jgi:hypothetical protein
VVGFHEIVTKLLAEVGILGKTVTFCVPDAKTAPVALQVMVQGRETLVVVQKLLFCMFIGKLKLLQFCAVWVWVPHGVLTVSVAAEMLMFAPKMELA